MKFSSDISAPGSVALVSIREPYVLDDEQQLALDRQRFEVVAEHPEQGIVEAQHVDRCHDLPALDPERRETRHPGHPARGTV